jgi:hypothetical protein
MVMDPSPPPQTDRVSSLICVTPLTQTKIDGTPYRRFANVEAEISGVLATDPSTWSPTTLKSETQVYLIRWQWRQNDQKSIGKLIECLGRRIARIARDFASGLNEFQAEDFAVEIGDEVNLLIFSREPSRQSEFLEIAFRQAVQRRAINKRTLLKERRKHEVAESSLRTADDDDDGEGIIASHADSRSAQESVPADEVIRRGLAAISNPLHRQAVVLHHLQDWPLSSKDPQIPTLSTHFGKSARQIQNWIATAFEEMRTALGDVT